MEEALTKEIFGNDDEVKNAVKWLVNEYAEVGREYFKRGIVNLVLRYDK